MAKKISAETKIQLTREQRAKVLQHFGEQRYSDLEYWQWAALICPVEAEGKLRRELSR